MSLPVRTWTGSTRDRRRLAGARVVLLAVALLLLTACSKGQPGQVLPTSSVPDVAGTPPLSTPVPTPTPDSTPAPTTSTPAPTTPATPGPSVTTVTVTPTTPVIPTTTATPPTPATPATPKPSPPRPTTTPLVPDTDPAPPCWAAGRCPALATAGLGAGWKVVVVDPSESASTMILLSGDEPFDQLGMRELGPRPVLECLTVGGAPTCLMSGIPGAHTAFGSVARVTGGRLQNLTATLGGKELFSEGGFSFSQSDAASALITGTVASFDYGLSYAASPKALTTYTVTKDRLTQTGCGVPTFQAPARTRSPLRGPCSGTPAVDGFGPGSAARILDLDSGILSPSGNIWCTSNDFSTGEVDCLINQTDFAVPKDCEGQPGTIVRWAVDGQPSLSGCQGDTMVQAGRNPIRYGQLAVGPGIFCVIGESSGVRCQNLQNHGFTLARAGFQTF